MNQRKFRKVNNFTSLSIGIILILLLTWSAALGSSHDEHTCHDSHCTTCVQISALKSIINHISNNHVSAAAIVFAAVWGLGIFFRSNQKDETISLVSLKVRMDD